MGAAAEFHGIAIERASITADLYHANGVPIFIAKELQNIASRADLVVGDFCAGYYGILNNAFVYKIFDVSDLLP